MTEPRRRHRLEGLEPDNLLAFLALLGLLRALETARPSWRPRAGWEVHKAPLRPFLEVSEPSPDAICEAASQGVQRLAEIHQFGDRTRLKLLRSEARSLLAEAARQAIDGDGRRGALWSALVNDAAAKPKDEIVERTPLCLLDVAQTAFLTNLAEVCSLTGSVGRGDSPRGSVVAIKAALLSTWRRQDDTRSFRWDPVEDSRHAYRWTAPTDDKQGVEHGANMLAAVGLPVLTVVPVQRSGDVRLDVIGGEFSRDGFAFHWPIWRAPASLSGIRTLLSHPSLAEDPTALAHLGVVEVRRARRISVGKFMNFMRAEPVAQSG